MELWIRSQDKRKLMKASNIYLDEEIEYDNGKYAIKCGTIDIGYYTFYRALEVLNEIQELLMPKFKLDTSSIQENGRSWVENGVILQNYTANADFIKLDTYVYKMPKE